MLPTANLDLPLPEKVVKSTGEVYLLTGNLDTDHLEYPLAPRATLINIGDAVTPSLSDVINPVAGQNSYVGGLTYNKNKNAYVIVSVNYPYDGGMRIIEISRADNTIIGDYPYSGYGSYTVNRYKGIAWNPITDTYLVAEDVDGFGDKLVEFDASTGQYIKSYRHASSSKSMWQYTKFLFHDGTHLYTNTRQGISRIEYSDLIYQDYNILEGTEVISFMAYDSDTETLISNLMPFKNMTLHMPSGTTNSAQIIESDDVAPYCPGGTFAVAIGSIVVDGKLISPSSSAIYATGSFTLNEIELTTVVGISDTIALPCFLNGLSGKSITAYVRIR